MNKVITINLNGKAYQLEEEGYTLLHGYLAGVRNNLNDNPDQDEIIKDFEQAIAEKCDKYITEHKNVVRTDEVQKIIAEMGPVDGNEATQSPHSDEPVVKRLYRVREGAWIAGVCNGIAIYFGMDVKIVRIIFIVLSVITHGGFIGAYVLMAFFVPAAETNEERAYAQGKHFNAQEFIEEMKEKYGKYGDEKYWKKYTDKYGNEKYWKKYANMHMEHRKKFSTAWRGFTRFGTGLFTFIGTLALIAVGIVYSIGMWGALVDHTIFGNKFLFGASPILLALFFTACAYIVTWPLKKMVNEARHHTWGTTQNPRPYAQIFGLILWFVAIGFVVVVGIKSFPDRTRTTYAPYGTDVWIHHHEFCIGGNYFCDPAAKTDENNKAAVETTVKNFGEVLQQVSLLAPAPVVKAQMEKAYSSYLTPALLQQWESKPDTALGHTTSSPHPDHIDIDSTTKNADGSYTVTAEVIEITDTPQDDIIVHDPITVTVVSLNNEWRISAVETGKH